MDSRIALGIGGALLAIGLAMSFFGTRAYLTARKRANTWVSHQASIKSLKLEPRNYTQSTGAKLTKTGYEVNAELTYSHNGRGYEAPLMLTFVRGEKDEAERELALAQSRKQVDIFVNPEKPTEITKYAGWDLPTFLVPIILGGIGVIMLLNGVGLIVTKGL